MLKPSSNGEQVLSPMAQHSHKTSHTVLSGWSRSEEDVFLSFLGGWDGCTSLSDADRGHSCLSLLWVWEPISDVQANSVATADLSLPNRCTFQEATDTSVAWEMGDFWLCFVYPQRKQWHEQ